MCPTGFLVINIQKRCWPSPTSPFSLNLPLLKAYVYIQLIIIRQIRIHSSIFLSYKNLWALCEFLLQTHDLGYIPFGSSSWALSVLLPCEPSAFPVSTLFFPKLITIQQPGCSLCIILVLHIIMISYLHFINRNNQALLDQDLYPSLYLSHIAFQPNWFSKYSFNITISSLL